MPEHFTDILGNWKSRAKETYRRTTLTKAQTEFCAYLGSTRADHLGTKTNSSREGETTTRLKNALNWIHSDSVVKQETRLRQAVDFMHEPRGMLKGHPHTLNGLIF